MFCMAYPYPPHHPALPYTGKQYYFLTFCTDRKRKLFTEPEAVNLVEMQFVRAASERRFEITAYCFMPDHVHVLVHGLGDNSDCKAFIKSAKQYSGFYFKKSHQQQLWQRYGFERVIRDDSELAFTIGYIVANPVRAGLVEHPFNYPHLGSQRYTVPELLEICDYDKAWV
jgi:putative transposase